MTLLAWHPGPPAGSSAAVLLHGWGEDGGAWATWQEPLAEAGFTASSVDLPGHGGSADLEKPRGVDPAAWAAEAITVDLARARIERPFLVGHGQGGMVAAHTATHVDVGALVLIDPDDRPPPPHATEAAGALRDASARLWTAEAAELVAQVRGRGHDRRVLAEWLEEAAWPSPPRLRAIVVPTLVVVGSTDPLRARAPRFAAGFRNGHLATAAGTADPPLGGAAVREIVVRFLRGEVG